MSLDSLADTIASIGGDILMVVGIGVAVAALIFALFSLVKGNMKKAIVGLGTAIFAAVIGVAGIGIVLNAAESGKEIVESTTDADGNSLIEGDKKITAITD